MLTVQLACAVPDETNESAAPTAPVTVGDLWDPGVPSGTVVTVDAVVTSGRTAAADAFYAQGPQGGPRSGLRVAVQGALVQWPPAVGTAVVLTGPVTYSSGRPVLSLRDDDDGQIGDDVGTTVDDLGGDDQGFALVRALGVTILSAVDPSGRADLSTSADLCGDFVSLLLPWQATGDLFGILDVDLCPRKAGDWVAIDDGSPWPIHTLASARDVADGTPVVLEDVSQAAPWSTDGRWTVLQDPVTGDGLWVDAEATGLAGAPGQRATWFGEIRFDDEGPRLRTWIPPLLPREDVAAIEVGVPTDGARVRLTVSGVLPADAFGNRSTAEGWQLDDRFGSVAELDDPVEVIGWVRGTTTLAVDGEATR